jgi:3-hydroxyacyl-[acyl-carrier-protein] dehydratase
MTTTATDTSTEPYTASLIAGWPLRADRQADGGLTTLATVDPADPVFAGHFPAAPLLPGVFLIEYAHHSALCAMAGDTADGAPRPVLTGVKSARFQQPVLPGDEIRAEVRVVTDDGSRQALVRVYATRAGDAAAIEAATIRLIYLAVSWT